MKPLVTRLNHADVIIPRGSEEAARAFYCSVLGFTEIPKPASLAKNGGLWVRVGDIQVHLSIQDGYDPRTTKAHLAYEVSSLEEMKARMTAQGLKWNDNVEIPGYIRGDVRDPFGNRIEFLQVIS